MAAITLRDSRTGSQARILPEMGFNCFEFQANVNGRMIDVLDAQPGFENGTGRPTGDGIPILFPFPNRIRAGKFQWDGKDYHIPTNLHGNAIHGFVLDRPWRVSVADDQTAIGEFQLSVDAPDRMGFWPADFLIEVRYTLLGPVLRADFRCVNADDKPLPWGLGTHPYFRAPLVPESAPKDVLVQVPAAEMWELSPDCLPTGKKLPVSGRTDLREGERLEGLKLDDVLTSLTPQGEQIETILMDAKGGVQVAQVYDSVFRECVVYTPPGRPSVCIEPYTCVTDAINLQPQGIDAGWRVLKPGDEFRTWIEIRASLIYA
jgi:aldose 1-epimerase